MKKIKLKDTIIELRKKGYSYNKIVMETGCSKGTIAYHCGEGQKEKYRLRNANNREKQHPLKQKIENFIYRKYKQKSNHNYSKKKVEKIIYQKIVGFSKIKGKDYNYMNFTVKDLLNKIGEEPCCALTGEKINLEDSKTYQLDHIIPCSKGGDNNLDNCQLVCREANQAKGDLTMEEFIELCRKVVDHSSKKKKNKLASLDSNQEKGNQNPL